MIDVIDYGFGNIGSVIKALEYIGYSCRIVDDPKGIHAASGVILPGVGAFGAAMDALRRNGLDLAIKEYIASGAPFLGVCLGMQLLFEKSEESGEGTSGLGILPGVVRRFPAEAGLKVPQIGWNCFERAPDPVFRKGDYVYFVHSYYCDPERDGDVAATATYGFEYACAVSRDNVLAMQFHPEKSGEVGLSILNRWARRTR
ncbi:MAG: imidazole glycerol phosphate synthase subunit HisH [Oscillospiraceae bacterium]|jgi:glutamine amidotransferase|nr:imidazole glycerol phosphate synthase subunit HisH [Oscillospiraceae bacterium]